MLAALLSVLRSYRSVLLTTNRQRVLQSRLYADFQVVVESMIRSSLRAVSRRELVGWNVVQVYNNRNDRVYTLQFMLELSIS